MGSGSSGSERKSESGSRRLVFEDVVLCPDVGSFNEFGRRYLSEHGLYGQAANRASWALFYAWKGSKQVG